MSATTGIISVMAKFQVVRWMELMLERCSRYNSAKLDIVDVIVLVFDADMIAVVTSIHIQSPDIARGVTNALETRTVRCRNFGAGDQGVH